MAVIYGNRWKIIESLDEGGQAQTPSEHTWRLEASMPRFKKFVVTALAAAGMALVVVTSSRRPLMLSVQ